MQNRHQVVVSVDIEDYSSRSPGERDRLQQLLLRALERSAEAAKLAIDFWETQPQGDGRYVVLPPDVHPGTIIGSFVTAFSAALSADQARRMRVRVAVDEGAIQPSVNGFADDHAINAARLRDSGPLRAAMAACPAAPLGIIVSQRIFEDYTGGHDGIAREEFRRVEFTAKNQPYVGYIRIPGHNVHDLPLDAPKPPQAAPATPVVNVNGTGAFGTLGDHATITQNFAR
ncbi:hypothetical protein OIE66_09425 [Nonomuraea sp. NBC_01738]|uniref:hypothetical protein n=1 Tax=Nonomuraea sp. NBC_01738 TaxID=2976003 RepID=UPI002E0E4135|nr:hypothetical protein OIE66_09425 [Nonomuraea sp. NBC_01738]